MSDARNAISSTEKHVVVVEDDADVREALVVALGRVGYDVTGACNGRDAIDHLTRAPVPPSLIVLDWMMPVMNGLDFLVHQASHPRFRRIPVLILSAVDRVHGFTGVTVAAVLTKPVRMRMLVDVVDRLCDMPPRPEGFLASQVTSRVIAPVVASRTVAMRRIPTKP